MRLLNAVLVTVLALFISDASGFSAALSSDAGHLFLIDRQFNPLVTRIHEVDPVSAALGLKGDLGVSYTPVLGIAAADALSFYIAGTGTSPANVCQGLRSCLLVKVVLDPGSVTPALVQVIGVIQQGGSLVPEITGLTFHVHRTNKAHSEVR